MTVKHTSHARYDLWYHLAFSTKYRKAIWTEPETRERVKALFRAIARHYDLEIGTIECLTDHLHCTVSAPPRLSTYTHLFLLDPRDIPYQLDGVRTENVELRDRVFQAAEFILKSARIPHTLLSGSVEHRLGTVTDFLEK